LVNPTNSDNDNCLKIVEKYIKMRRRRRNVLRDEYITLFVVTRK